MEATSASERFISKLRSSEKITSNGERTRLSASTKNKGGRSLAGAGGWWLWQTGQEILDVRRQYRKWGRGRNEKPRQHQLSCSAAVSL